MHSPITAIRLLTREHHSIYLSNFTTKTDSPPCPIPDEQNMVTFRHKARICIHLHSLKSRAIDDSDTHTALIKATLVSNFKFKLYLTFIFVINLWFSKSLKGSQTNVSKYLSECVITKCYAWIGIDELLNVGIAKL